MNINEKLLNMFPSMSLDDTVYRHVANAVSVADFGSVCISCGVFCSDSQNLGGD